MLNINTDISSQNLQVMIPVVGGLIGYMIYWFTQESPALKAWLINRYGAEKGAEKLILSTKYLGAFTIGVLPLFVYLIVFPDTELDQLGFWYNEETRLLTFLWMLGLGAVMIFIFAKSAKTPTVLAKQPEIRTKEWSRNLLIRTLAAWAVYLLGYEFFFRGLLLYPLVDAFGIWPAILVNVVMYAGLHVPKGLDEAIGAIPLSVVLCLLGVLTGTFWISYIVHVAMAWTITLVTLKHQPDMRIVKITER